jgi:hypothetical protein
MVYLQVGDEGIGLHTWRVPANMRAVCKVHGLTLLLYVGTLWRCGDGLFFQVTPLASNALLTMLHLLLKNMLQTIDHFEISCLCLAWKKWMGGTPLEHPPYSPYLTPCNFWAFPTIKRKLQHKKFQSDQWSAAHF